MQTQKDHMDTVVETKVIEQEPVHPMFQGTQEIPERHYDDVIVESHVHNTSNTYNNSQNVQQGFYSQQPFQPKVKNIVKKNYETHITHVKTNQSKFLKENEKLKKHYEDYIQQLETENKRLAALERELEQLKDRRRSIQADIVKYKTELEILQSTPQNSYEVEELQKQVKKLERENIDLMDTINIKKNQIIELEENIDVNNTEVEVERQKLHERITHLKHQISIKKPEIIVKEIVKEKYVHLPPLEPKVVKKFVAPPVVIKECNCGCICHDEGVNQNKQQSVSYYTHYQQPNQHHHVSQSNQHQFQKQEHQVQSKQPLFDQQNSTQYYNSHHSDHHTQYHQEHQVQSNNNINNIIEHSYQRQSQLGERYGSPRVSELKITGIYETTQRGNDVQTNFYETEEQYKSARGKEALF